MTATKCSFQKYSHVLGAKIAANGHWNLFYCILVELSILIF